MTNKRGVLFFPVALIAMLSIAITAFSAELQNSDCIKCHQKEPGTIDSKGGKHKTAVTCLDCHTEHPPQGKEAIPACSNCHSGKSHYELSDCFSCHSDPHAPLDMHLAGDVTGPCLTCHAQQGNELGENPSKHTELSCTFCHAVHKEIPECSQCHEPHAQGQTQTDCLVCHPVHMPMVIKYPMVTPRNFCTSCHEAEGELMNKTITKHQNFTCAFCHRGKHKVIPGCNTCHGEPHSPETHKKMPNCLDCHLNAHNLVK